MFLVFLYIKCVSVLFVFLDVLFINVLMIEFRVMVVDVNNVEVMMLLWRVCIVKILFFLLFCGFNKKYYYFWNKFFNNRILNIEDLIGDFIYFRVK